MEKNNVKFGHDKHNEEIVSITDKKRICGYFMVSDLHKVTPLSICESKQRNFLKKLQSMRTGYLNLLCGMQVIRLIQTEKD